MNDNTNLATRLANCKNFEGEEKTNGVTKDRETTRLEESVDLQFSKDLDR